MRNILFFSIVFSCSGFIGCMPMSSEQKTIVNEEKKTDSSFIKLVQKLRGADTILLTSHTGVVINTTTGETKVIEPEIMTGDKINRKIIKEQKVITGNDIDTLIGILSVPKKEGDSYGANCFDPHHTIFIIKKNRISYIDLCFHCAGAATSKDLTDIRPLGDSKFVQLLSFFRRLKLDYKLPETIYPKDM